MGQCWADFSHQADTRKSRVILFSFMHLLSSYYVPGARGTGLNGAESCGSFLDHSQSSGKGRRQTHQQGHVIHYPFSHWSFIIVRTSDKSLH
jgi:hypothetical protein